MRICKNNCRILETLDLAHQIWIGLGIIYATIHLFLLRDSDLRVVLLFLVPPMLACIVLASRRSSSSARFASRLFLLLIGAAIIVGEQPAIFPNLRPHFPGVPLRQDRILTIYMVVYVFFAAGFVPPYVFVTGLYNILAGLHCSISRQTCMFGLIAWCAMAVFFAFGATEILKSFF